MEIGHDPAGDDLGAARAAPGWKRSLIILRESEDGWNVTVNFEHT